MNNQMRGFVIIFFLTVSSVVASQTKVVKESEPADPAYTRAFNQVQKLDKEISAAWKKIEPSRQNHGPNKEDIKKFISYNLRIKGQLESSGIDSKCRQINTIWSRFKNSGYSKRKCNSVANRIKSIDTRIARARKKLGQIQADSKFKKGQNFLDQINKDKIKKLDKEVKSLDEQLKRSEERLRQRKKKKRLSLDDFVKTKSKKVTKTKSLSDFLTKGSSKSLTGGSSHKKSKSLADQLGGLESKNDSKTTINIKTRNGLTGVVDSRGKVLIPFRKWNIKQYKMGIAEVTIPVNTKVICSRSITTYKKGFVNKSGQFVDGYDVDVSSYTIRSTGNTTLMLRKDPCNEYGVSWEKREACQRLKERLKRERERKAALAKKKREMERKRCSLKVNQYIQSEYSRY